MFADAIEKISSAVRPVVACRRNFDKSTETTGSALLIINKEGHFISAAHAFEVVPLAKIHASAATKLAVKTIDLKKKTTPEAKRELKKLKPDKKWITASSLWPGSDDQSVTDLNVIPDADILIGRLDPFDPSMVSNYPIFKSPDAEVRIGTGLCKLGFAFNELETEFDASTNGFKIDFKNLVPFPLEGMYTRNIAFKGQNTGKDMPAIQPKFIETSTPGLKGHSGGPLVDKAGRVWGIQSRTAHIPLGINPVMAKGSRREEIEQFLNVSWAIHPEVIIQFLKEHNIDFKSE